MLLLLLTALQADSAEAFFSRVTIDAYRPLGPVQDKVVTMIRDKEQWLSAYRAVEATLGPWPADTSVRAGFDYRGDQLAKARGPAKAGEVLFNMDRLEEVQIKLDELEAKRIELAKQKIKMVFKVPPIRLDRVLWHELTHVWQDGEDAPDWFLEGMAQHVAKDESMIAAFARSGRDLPSLDGRRADKNDAYVRGQLFWAWLDTQGAVKPVARAWATDKKAWKTALEETLKQPWEAIQAAERAWTQAELDRVREKVR